MTGTFSPAVLLLKAAMLFASLVCHSERDFPGRTWKIPATYENRILDLCF